MWRWYNNLGIKLRVKGGPYYDKQFKMLQSTDKSVLEINRNLNISGSSFHRWINEYDESNQLVPHKEFLSQRNRIDHGIGFTTLNLP